jgi:hypothetical protein
MVTATCHLIIRRTGNITSIDLAVPEAALQIYGAPYPPSRLTANAAQAQAELAVSASNLIRLPKLLEIARPSDPTPVVIRDETRLASHRARAQSCRMLG